LAKKPVGVTKVEDAEGKQKALDAVLGLINKNYGAGAVQKLGEATGLDIESISLGAPSLDMALGIGGIPAGRVVEIYGPESSGKTTVALQAVASVQKSGGTAAFIDAEHALDPVYAANLGVDIDSLLVSQPDTGEQALEIMDMLVGSGAVDIVVVDSVAALVPRAEIEGDMGDSHVGLQARMMSQALRKITGRLSGTGTTAIFINQLREKIGVFFGNPETTTGGKALKFYASVRIDIRRVTTLKDKAGNPIGNHTRAKIVKNKVAPPFKMAEFDITYGKGVDTLGNIRSMAVGQDIVSAPFEEFGMKAEHNIFVAGLDTEVENMPGIYVGGDCATGPSTVIRAIAAGKVAAHNIDEYLGYHHKLHCEAVSPEPKENIRTLIGRTEIGERPAFERKKDFECVEEEMTYEEAMQECSRCLRCDHFGCGAMEGGTDI